MRTDTLVYGDVAKEIEQGGKEVRAHLPFQGRSIQNLIAGSLQAGVMQASIFDVMNDWFFDKYAYFFPQQTH